MALGYTRSDMAWGLKGRSNVKVTRSTTVHNHTSFQTTTALHSHSLGGDTNEAIRRGFELYEYILVHSVIRTASKTG